MRTRSNRVLLGLLACSLLGATCGSRAPDALEGSGLDEAGRGYFRAALQALRCPPDASSVCPARTQRLAVELARLGATAGEIVLEVERYQASLREPASIVAVADAPCRGREQAPVTVVVFSDFECPACANLVPTLQALQGQPQVRVCFRYFPLDSHPHSRLTAQAAHQAHLEGRFWELHDLFFAHQDDLSLERVLALVQTAGADAEAIARAVRANAHLALVEASKADGKALGVTGTPSAFVNGHRLTLPLLHPFLAIAVEDHAELARGGPDPDRSSNERSKP